MKYDRVDSCVLEKGHKHRLNIVDELEFNVSLSIFILISHSIFTLSHIK